MRSKTISKILRTLIILSILLTINTSNLFSQNGVSINTSGAVADPSAMLDVSGALKGVLINRMTTVERDNIISPAEGLLIFNTSTKCFDFYSGSMWLTLSCGCITPSSAGNVSGPAIVCQGQTGANYSVAPVPNASGYIWVLPPGATIASGSNTNSISVNYSGSASSGDVSVFGTSISCGNGSVSANFPVIVNGIPLNASASLSSSSLCEGGTLTLNGSATNATSWSWTGPDNFTSSLQNPVINNVTVNASGVYSLTVSNACGSAATVNTATLSVSPNLPASVSIAANPGNTICDGENVIFTATPANGGTTPTYQWYINGNTAGTNSNTFSSTTMSDGDEVTCEMTSSACVTGSPAMSNSITMTVIPNLPASISIVASTNPICSGNPVTFTATPVNGGGSPVYQWQINGNPAGTNSSSFTTSGINSGDVVNCVMTSSICATGSPATSNDITMTVTANPLVQLNIPSTYNGKSSYAYTGGTQTFNVPSCVAKVYVKIWGAGGGGGKDNNTYGGAGAYVGGYLDVTPGDNLTVIVGGGGLTGTGSSPIAGGFGGGGSSGGNSSGSYSPASGGGRSAIQITSGTDAVTAGGGGGSGGIGWNNQRPYGGGGGATTGGFGGDGYSGGNGPGSGHGGTITAGGTPSTGGSIQSVAGSYLTGSAGGSSYYGGGGSGGGYYGGSGGSGVTGVGNVGGGGGGSSYTSNLTSVNNIAGGNGQSGGPYIAPNSSDIDFVTGVGTGANVGQNGGHGRIVIYW